jgi:hypothetical protein
MALATSACGLGLDEDAQPITSVPFSLLATTSTSEVFPDNPAFGLQLFWISSTDEGLIVVERRQNDQPSIQDALDALVGGPNEAELESFPDARTPSSVSRSLNPVALPVTAAGILIIEVDDGTELREANRLPAAVIVCTVTQFKLIKAVEIRDADGAIPLSGLNSESIEGAATRTNFNDCVPTPEEPLPEEEPVEEDS